MARTKLIRTNLSPYHVTIRTNNKEWFDLPMSLVWKICIDSLNDAHSKCPVKVQAFVLMSNHYHLLLWTPNSNLDKFMFYLNSNISKKLRFKTGRINRVFGDRYRWSVIEDQKYYDVVLKYIYQNPLKKNLAVRCEDYKYSTLYYHLGNERLPFDLYRPTHGELGDFLRWVNQSMDKDRAGIVGKAVRRSKFKFTAKEKNNSAMHF